MPKATAEGHRVGKRTRAGKWNKMESNYRSKHREVSTHHWMCPWRLVLSVTYCNEASALHLLRLPKPCHLDLRLSIIPGHKNPGCAGWQQESNRWCVSRVRGAPSNPLQLGSCLSTLFPRNRFSLMIVSSNDFCLISTVISANSPSMVETHLAGAKWCLTRC